MTRAPRAFTLIELTVVIGIVAVLAATLLPVITQPDIQQRRAEASHEMASIAEAIRGRPELGDYGYLGTVGAVPTLVDSLFVRATTGADTAALPSTTAAGTVLGWVGPYARVNGYDVKTDPWGKPYTLPQSTSGAQVEWRVHSDGPDRTSGTSDDLDYPSAARGWPSVVETLTIEIMRQNSPALLPLPTGTPVTITFARQGAATTLPSSGTVTTDGNSRVTFTSTAGNAIPLGEISVGVTPAFEGVTYQRRVLALQRNSFVKVIIPTPNTAYSATSCQLTNSGTSPDVNGFVPTTGCNVGWVGVAGQIFDVTVSGGWHTTGGTACQAAVSLYAADIPNGAAIGTPAYAAQSVNSSTPNQPLLVQRTVQLASSQTIQPRLYVQPSTCVIDLAQVVVRTWKPQP